LCCCCRDRKTGRWPVPQILPGNAGLPARRAMASLSALRYAGRLTNLPRGVMQSTADPGSEVITLGGGCFWCIEAVYLEVEGVVRVESGYAGGQVPNPTYEA